MSKEMKGTSKEEKELVLEGQRARGPLACARSPEKDSQKQVDLGLDEWFS